MVLSHISLFWRRANRLLYVSLLFLHLLFNAFYEDKKNMDCKCKGPYSEFPDGEAFFLFTKTLGWHFLLYEKSQNPRVDQEDTKTEG